MSMMVLYYIVCSKYFYSTIIILQKQLGILSKILGYFSSLKVKQVLINPQIFDF